MQTNLVTFITFSAAFTIWRSAPVESIAVEMTESLVAPGVGGLQPYTAPINKASASNIQTSNVQVQEAQPKEGLS